MWGKSIEMSIGHCPYSKKSMTYYIQLETLNHFLIKIGDEITINYAMNHSMHDIKARQGQLQI